MFALAKHGGKCCGAVHLYNFPYEKPTQAMKNKLKEKLQRIKDYYGHGQGLIMVQVILDPDQLEFWEDYLVNKVGFKVSESWENVNTDNELTMLTLLPDNCKLLLT